MDKREITSSSSAAEEITSEIAEQIELGASAKQVLQMALKRMKELVPTINSLPQLVMLFDKVAKGMQLLTGGVTSRSEMIVRQMGAGDVEGAIAEAEIIRAKFSDIEGLTKEQQEKCGRVADALGRGQAEILELEAAIEKK